MADSDSEEEVGWDDEGSNANTPANGGIFGFLPSNVNEMNDDSEMFPDEAQSSIGFMAPSDNLLANKLLTSSESKSAYKLQKKVNIEAMNEPIILFSDRSNGNEAIIDYNQLLSTVNIELPNSVILYSANSSDEKNELSTNEKEQNNEKANNDSNKKEEEKDDDDDILASTFWQKQFNTTANIQKHFVLQNSNVKYRNLKFEYDKYCEDKNGTSDEPLLTKLLKNTSRQIEIKSSNQFESVVNELKASNPQLFKEETSSNEDEHTKQMKIKQNIRRLTGYDDINESELLAIDPHNIKTDEFELDLSTILQHTQCNFEQEIIVNGDDGYVIDETIKYIQQREKEYDKQQNENDDIQMTDASVAESIQPKVTELKPIEKKLNEESFLRAKFETRQKMDKFEAELKEKNSKKRKERDEDFDFFQASKRRKISSRNKITFNITNYKITPERRKSGSSKMEEDDDNMDLMVPENEKEQYDDDAIGDDLFDIMPDVEEDWNGNDNAETFGTVKDDTSTKVVDDEQKVNEENNQQQDSDDKVAESVIVNEPESKKPIMPLLKCASNNSSIWPNENREFASCEWLDSVIVSDDIKPKRAMNTNLIINLNDHRMEWTEEFVKNMMTKLKEQAQNAKNNENDKKEMTEEDEEKKKMEELKRKFALDKFNLSNDKMYFFKDYTSGTKRTLHTPMAYDLDKEIFAHKQNVDDWVNLHRKPIKLKSESIKIVLSSKSAKYAAERKNVHSMYVPKNWRELSAANRDDRIILMEYLEEYPLIIQSVGMSSNITTLYRKSKAEYDARVSAPEISVSDGTVKILNPNQKSPLLGAPRQTKHVTVLENKLYVAPIRSHTKTLNYPSANLFLLVGNGHTYYIRKIDAVFAVGQIQPKQVVYHPASRQFKSYIKDRCKVHIYKLLQKRAHATVAEIVKDFPLVTEDAIKEKLKDVASHDKQIGAGYWIRHPWVAKLSDLEIRQMVSPEQEVLRQIFMNTYCRLYKSGISHNLIGRGGGWKRVLKNLVFNRDLLDNMNEIKQELENEKKEWDKAEEEKQKNVFADIKNPLLNDTNPTLRLKALQLIEELLFCTSWYLSDQFLRCYRGEGEMQLGGWGNPFKDGQGFNYLRDKDKTSSEAIKLMSASAGNRANTKADYRRMPLPKALQILKQRYLVPDAVLEKLDRRKIMELLQKKSREALSAGSQNKMALRYARLTGSRKTFAKNEYTKKIRKLMKQHLLMLRGGQSRVNEGEDNDELDELNDLGLDDVEMDMDDDEDESENDGDVEMKQQKKKKKKMKKVIKIVKKLRYTYSYNDPITGDRKKEIEEYSDKEMIKKYELCKQEGDKKFLRLKEYSKLEKHRQELEEEYAENGEAPKFMNDRQKEKYMKMQRIKNMSDEERKKILKKLAELKPYITCSVCKHKGHNANNKYCPFYHQTKEKKKQQNGGNDDGNSDDEDPPIDSFIDRAIDKKHQSYNRLKRKKKPKRKKLQELDESDPRLQFVEVLKHIMSETRKTKGYDQFRGDPYSRKELLNYRTAVQNPMCLDWIDENINYTEECIKAPYLEHNMNNNENKPKVTTKRERGRPNKQEYKTFAAFKEDIDQIKKNCVTYNGPESPWTKQAEEIVEVVNGLYRKNKTVIDALNIEVEATYQTFELQPIMEKLIGGLLKAPILTPFQRLDSYRKSASDLTINGLWDLRQKVHDKHYQSFGDFVNDIKAMQQFCYELEIKGQNKNEFATALKMLPTQFENKLEPYKKDLEKIDSDSAVHFRLNRKPPYNQ